MTRCDKCGGAGSYVIQQPASLSSRRYTCSACIAAMKYAGVGARETPSGVAAVMVNIAFILAARGYALRSGEAKPKAQPTPGTESADLAFERGCDAVNGPKVIRTPTELPAAMSHAAHYHPNWDACSDYAKMCHARNSLIVLGDWLDDPVRFIVCWTPNGAVTGGTGQALRVAAAYNIPVFNLAVTPVEALWEFLT